MINWRQLSVIALLIVAVSADTQEAICILQPTADATTPVSGVVTFKNVSSDPAVPIQITLVASGLPPIASLGFHVHQFGYIGTTNGLGVGGHWNPYGVLHGYPDNPVRHVGDMGNITTDANGNVNVVLTSELIKLQDTASVVGRALVIHEKNDNGADPSGNAGKRIEQCVIGISNVPDNTAVANVQSAVLTAEMKRSLKLKGRLQLEQKGIDVVLTTRICGFEPNSAHTVAIANSGDLSNITGSVTVLTDVLADSLGIVDATAVGLSGRVSLSGAFSVAGRSAVVFPGTDTSNIASYSLIGVLGIKDVNPGLDIICDIPTTDPPTPTPTPEAAATSSGIEGYQVALIIIAVIIVLFAVVAVVIYGIILYRKSKDPSRNMLEQPTIAELDSQGSPTTPDSPYHGGNVRTNF